MQRELCQRITETLKSAPIHDNLGYEALAYLKLPGPDYLVRMRQFHEELKPKLYVEIGVERGASLKQALPETRVIGIDPLSSVAGVFATTSDEFFKIEANREKCRGFDLAFIDGDHSFDQSLRDFENLEKLAKSSSIICLHDVIPMDERTAQPKAEGVSFHTGDVWKLMVLFVHFRPEFIAFTIACPPTGLGIVCKLPPSVRDLDYMRACPIAPFRSTWDDQVKLLNIIPNTDEAIKAAFQR